jgi:hypothetical protein
MTLPDPPKPPPAREVRDAAGFDLAPTIFVLLALFLIWSTR